MNQPVHLDNLPRYRVLAHQHLYCSRRELRAQLIRFDHFEPGRQLAERVLALSEQQLLSGRNDHARSERMLECYEEVRPHVVSVPAAGLCKRGVAEHYQVAQIRSLNGATAAHLGALLLLTAASIYDDSAYSLEWHRVLRDHANDLRQITLSEIEGLSTEQIGPVGSPLPGLFKPTQTEPQRAQILAMSEWDNYDVLPDSGGARFVLSGLLIIRVDCDGARRDYDFSSLISHESQLPDLTSAPRLSTPGEPAGIVYTDRTQTVRETLYAPLAQRFVWV